MAINENSFVTSTNIQFASSEMPGLWWNAQSFTIPPITMSPPEINTRSGSTVVLASDTVDYGEVTITAILDKEWKVYDELYQYFIKRLNVEKGTFEKEKTYDLWIELYDGKGNKIKRFDFYRCRISNFGAMEFNTTDQEDTLKSLDLTFTFDYFDYDNMLVKERLGTLPNTTARRSF